MQRTMIDVLAERVERLERENRRWKRAGATVLALGGLAVFMGQAAPKPVQIRAQRVVVTDEEGNERIVLGADKERSSILLKTEPGKATAVLAVAKESAGLSIADENGKLRVNLGKDLRTGGGAGLWLYDEQGGVRYTAGVDRRGPGVALYDESGKRIH